MARTIANWATRLVALLLVVAAVSAILTLTGRYDVAVSSPHTQAVTWALREAMARSVRAHARGVRPPAGLNPRNPALAAQALEHYDAVCRMCHGGPGVGREDWVQLYPPPPSLTSAEVVHRWSDAELFWIVKHGIKDTGMPAADPDHADVTLWALAALVRQLPSMTPEQYRAGLAGSGVERERAAEHAEHHEH